MESAQRYNAVRRNLDSILQEVGSFLLELVEGPVDELATDRQRLIDGNLHNFWDTYYSIKQRHADEKFTVAVLALTKSGKSTLLNAFIGDNLLPANNIPETARICRLVHVPELSGEKAVLTEKPLSVAGTDQQAGQLRVQGVSEINNFLRDLNQAVRTREYVKKDEALLEVEVSMAALSEIPAASSVTLQLLDTPGPNEAGEEGLRFQVERLLESVDAVVYLLDYTKLKTQEEANVLQRLKQINPQLVKRLAQRLFFVVNKVDLMAYTEGLDHQQTREYVAELITQQMGTECFQLSPEQVLLVSAREALLSRLILLDNHSRDSLFQFCRMAFGVRRNPDKVPQSELRDVAAEVLCSSGLLDLEERVISFLYSQAGELKVQATLDNLAGMMQQVSNVCSASTAALQAGVEELERSSASLNEQLSSVLAQFDLVQQEAEIVEGMVTDTIRNRMECLKCHLFERVNAALYGQTEHGRPTGRWSRVWQAARSLFASESQSRCSRQELQQRLHQLHNEVMAEINTEVNEFWHTLEVATNQQQTILFAQLNSLIEQLSRMIEEAVSESLNVRLEPVDLQLVPPTPEQFHSDLEQLFARGIHSEQHEESRSSHRGNPWQEIQDSLCRWGDFYFHHRPMHHHHRRERQRRWVEVCTLEQDEVVQYFVETIDAAIENSLRNVRSFVRSYISAQIEAARGVITQYGERYTTAMIAALEQCKKGEEHRRMALERVHQQNRRLKVLTQQISYMQQNAESSTPMAPLDLPPDFHMLEVQRDWPPAGDINWGSSQGATASNQSEAREAPAGATVPQDGERGLLEATEPVTATSPEEQSMDTLCPPLYCDQPSAAVDNPSCHPSASCPLELVDLASMAAKPVPLLTESFLLSSPVHGDDPTNGGHSREMGGSIAQQSLLFPRFVDLVEDDDDDEQLGRREGRTVEGDTLNSKLASEAETGDAPNSKLASETEFGDTRDVGNVLTAGDDGAQSGDGVTLHTGTETVSPDVLPAVGAVDLERAASQARSSSNASEDTLQSIIARAITGVPEGVDGKDSNYGDSRDFTWKLMGDLEEGSGVLSVTLDQAAKPSSSAVLDSDVVSHQAAAPALGVSPSRSSSNEWDVSLETASVIAEQQGDSRAPADTLGGPQGEGQWADDLNLLLVGETLVETTKTLGNGGPKGVLAVGCEGGLEGERESEVVVGRVQGPGVVAGGEEGVVGKQLLGQLPKEGKVPEVEEETNGVVVENEVQALQFTQHSSGAVAMVEVEVEGITPAESPREPQGQEASSATDSDDWTVVGDEEEAGGSNEFNSNQNTSQQQTWSSGGS